MRLDSGSHKISNIAMHSKQIAKESLVQTNISANYSKKHRNISKNLEAGMDLCLIILYFKVFSSTKVCLSRGSIP